MTGPSWVPYSFAVVMVAVSVYCAGRVLVARRWQRTNHLDVNLSHILMGLGMAAMLAPRHDPVPASLGTAVFAALAAWFVIQSARFIGRFGLAGSDDDHVHHISHYLVHALMAVAMVYMYQVGVPRAGAGSATSVMSMSGTGSGSVGVSGITLVLVLALIGSAIWQFDSISRVSPAQLALLEGQRLAAAGDGGGPTPPVLSPWLAPRLDVACHIVMCVTMGYMLVLML